MSITDLVRANIRDLTPYQSARRIGGQGHIWLNANEAPDTPALKLSRGDYNRYPEPQPAAVIHAYAAYAGVDSACVLVSRGGDEAIELHQKTYCDPGDAILYCPPTYGMYSISAATLGIAQKTVPLTADYQPDLPAIEAALPGVKLLYLCHPNNPTGTLLRRADLIALLERTAGRALVILDEAYIDYTPAASAVDLLPHYPHLAIIRTLSKAFALAGLRCGFTLGHPEHIAQLQKTIAPYPLPGPVADLAAQALQANGIAAMQARVALTVAERERMAAALRGMPAVAAVHDSAANYLLVHCHDGPRTFAALSAAGIITRDQHTAYGLANHIRITIGSVADMAATLDVLRDL